MLTTGTWSSAGRRRRISVAFVACLALSGLLSPPEVRANDFDRVLHRGKQGRDVKALEIRVAAWFPKAARKTLRVDRRFGHRTMRAVKAFQRHYGLAVDGVAGPQTYTRLKRLQDGDGSTAHFVFREFKQHYNSACSRRANAYAGSFRGGKVGRRGVKRNIIRVMWRLEAIRAKAGGREVVVVSGFRSIPYGRCIGSGSLSQHLFGTAADIQIAGVGGHRERRLARGSQVHGIECYSTTSHNHFDLRIENKDLAAYRYWYWPKRDRRGRDLASDGRPCRGER